MTHPDPLREARMAMYELISERVTRGDAGDWMHFENAMNAAFDKLALATPPADTPDLDAAWDGLSEAMEAVSLSPEVDAIIARHRPIIEAVIRAQP